MILKERNEYLATFKQELAKAEVKLNVIRNRLIFPMDNKSYQALLELRVQAESKIVEIKTKINNVKEGRNPWGEPTGIISLPKNSK